MKTTDLIPILLYQLKDGDKYGLELVESIKSVSAGQLEIKQPTLYPLLKKLEKSKFISSYWQDSEIGGKRHYYKITENGLLQLDTYPPIDDVIKTALDDSDSSVYMHEEVDKVEEELPSKSPSPFDDIFADAFQPSAENQPVVNEDDTNAEIQDVDNTDVEDTQDIVGGNMVENFDESNDVVEQNIVNTAVMGATTDDISPVESIDNAIDYADDNAQASEVSQIETGSPTDSFDIFDVLPYGNNEEKKEDKTSDFVLNNPFFEVDKKDEVVEEFKNQPSFSQESEKAKNLFVSAPTTTKPKLNTVSTETEYRDYIDYKNDPKIVHSKKIAKSKLLQLSATSVVGLILLFSLLAVCLQHKTTPLFVVIFIIYTLYIVFGFVRFVGDYKMLRLKIDMQNINYNFKKQILIRSIAFGVILLGLLIANLVGLSNGNLFAINNFGNFLAPVILSLMLFVDWLLSLLFFKVLLNR